MQYNFVNLRPTVCNICGGKVLLKTNKRANTKFYVCSECGARVGTHKSHPDVALGILLDQEGRQMRVKCHELFDSLWRDETNPKAARKIEYCNLAARLNIPSAACHFGYFNKSQLNEVLKILQRMQEERKFIMEKNIKNLLEKEVGELIDGGKFLLTDVHPCVSKDGSLGWYEVLLEDKTGKIKGNLWREASLSVPTFYSLVGKVVVVNGLIREYKGRKEINITKLCEATDYEVSDFIRKLGKEDMIKLQKKLFEVIAEIKDEKIRSLAEIIFKGSILDRFSSLPAESYHHNFNGGLLVWSLEILEAALSMVDALKVYSGVKEYAVVEINRDLIIAGALMSGLGKLSAYDLAPISHKKKRGQLVQYTTDSLMFVTMYITKLPPDKRMSDTSALAHVILASSGDILPRTKEAMIISQATKAIEIIDSYDVAIDSAYSDDVLIYNKYMKDKIYREKEELVC